jgi:hypothetical protein
MYEFVTGPMVWLSFGIFFGGLFLRLFNYLKGLNWQMDRVTYHVNTSYGIRGAARSIFYWLLPFGTRGWRLYPGFTVLVFVFHFTLLITPVFLLSHNMLLKEKLGISFWTMPEFSSDIMTIVVILSAVFLLMRRFALPEVRALTTSYDLVIMVIAVTPFVTGFFSFHQVGNYNFWVVVHVICGEVMLIAIPFTKLSHFLLFFLSRWQLGMDYGIKRGGMKSRGIAW